MDYIQIDKTSKRPIYNQIVTSLEDAILTHRLPNGYHLPTEKEIADFYNVSIGIVKLAFAQLEEMNLVLRIKGKGSYVKNRTQHTFDIKDLRLEVETYIPFHTALFEKKKTSKLDPSIFRFFKDQYLYHIVRIYHDEYTSLAIEESYLLPDTIKRLEYEIRSGLSVSKILLNTTKYHFVRQQNTMFAQPADSKLSKIFSIGIGDPVSRFESIFYDEANEVVALMVRYFPSEYTVFESGVQNVKS